MEGLLAGISGMGTAVAEFRAATAAGFTISARGGDVLVRAIDRMVQQSDRLAFEADRLSLEPPLGTTPAARVYKPFLATISSDPDQGFKTALTRFRADLIEMKTQVTKAMEHYRTTDQDAEDGVTAAGGPMLSA
ncbi:hypothetical protein EDD40_5782 [Saccharothrix texasensis]|uniref:Excreted virulence factor EspC (Type VII ESX diderm) n=1 Tax=Saccharothrix texasensis TaxID=103734 RepID=A0A3N1HCY1_9PSEU|nr:hypothetical protein EDD40_5782 [Saccharothrix texasensis]